MAKVFPPHYCLVLCSLCPQNALGRSSLKQGLPGYLWAFEGPVCWLMPSCPWSPLSLASQEEQHSLQSPAMPRGLGGPSTGQQYPACVGQDDTLSRKCQVLRVDVLSPKGGRAAPRRGLCPPAGLCHIQPLVKAFICSHLHCVIFSEGARWHASRHTALFQGQLGVPQLLTEAGEDGIVIDIAGEPQTNLQTNCAVPVPSLSSTIEG